MDNAFYYFDKLQEKLRSYFSGIKDGSFHASIKRSIVGKEAGFQIFMFLFVISVAVLFIHYVERYLAAPNQIVIGWGALVFLIIIARVKIFIQPPYRFVFLLLAGFISLRYFVWRTFETLIYTDPFDLIGLLLLYVAEVYALALHFLGLFISIWPVVSDPVPLPDDLSLLPTIDIYIPTYTESLEIVRITATASTRIDYPKDKIYIHILDDGSSLARRNNPETSKMAWERYHSLKKMAGELGINYIAREINNHAKAGNINYALKHTSAELILILDCDHVPTKDILTNTVGCFLQDKKLFLVQTPHFFINPSPVEKALDKFSKVPGENEMFYRAIHPGLDSWNSSYFCGSAAVLRRKYLEEVGGISGETITEDAETSFHLHNKGYNSIYINRPMVCGLSPETFDDYILQRTRWAQGMIQLFILNNPLFAKGLTVPQRICYLNSCFFWFFGIPRFIFYIAPAAFLILGLKVYHASVIQVVAYALPHLFCSFITMDFLYGRVRQPFFSEIYESVQSLFLIPPILSVILNPRKPTFKVTPKGKRLEKEHLNPMATTFSLVILINLIAIPLAMVKWFNYPLYRDVIVITFSWCIFNLLLALASLGTFWERRQVRNYHRIRATGTVSLFVPRLNQSAEGEITDISLTGMAFELSLPFSVEHEEEVLLKVQDSYGEWYEFQAKIQRNKKAGDKTFVGVEFLSDKETYSQLVKFVYGDSKRWMDQWEERPQTSTLQDLLHFIRMGLRGSREILISVSQATFTVLKGYLYELFTKINILYQRVERLVAVR